MLAFSLIVPTLSLCHSISTSRPRPSPATFAQAGLLTAWTPADSVTVQRVLADCAAGKGLGTVGAVIDHVMDELARTRGRDAADSDDEPFDRPLVRRGEGFRRARGAAGRFRGQPTTLDSSPWSCDV